MSMTQASSNYFEQVARQWDTLRSGYFTEAVRTAAIEKAYLRPEMVVADIGAGTGFITAGLAPLVQKVIAIDGSPAMLEVARKNLAPFNNVEYQVGEGLALPLPDGSVDAAFANMYLHHCPDPLAAIAEMVRIIKPGGRLVITDMDTHPYEWLKDEMADEWMGFERDQVRAWFKAVDLVNVIVDCTGESCCAESHNPELKDAQGRSASISIFVATGTRRLRMQSAVREAYSAAAQSKPLDGGCGCGTPTKAGQAVEGATTGAASQSACGCGDPREAQSSMAKSACCSGEGSDVAAASTACCTGEVKAAAQDKTSAIGYSPEERATVPAEAEEISLGCGNPIAMARLRPGEIVLDIGSGGGMDSFLAAARVSPQGRVIGVDMTPAMLERARKTAVRSGVTNVEFRQGQAESLPLEDGLVDVVLSNCVINLCEDKGLVFREAHRVLKPGGRLEVSDVVTSGPPPLEARLNAGEWAGCVSGALPEAEYLDLVAQAGFTDVVARRSQTYGEAMGVKVFSVIVSARK